ncbi:MAG: HlyC/CorC family transporter [Bacteroidales bacterium]|nr:HlyC/CorC family transporter [Bacteroidales bacterium]
MLGYTGYILITLVLSAFFSGMEIAYVSANKLRLELDRKQGGYASRMLAVFIGNPSKYLTTMLVGNNIALVVYGMLMAAILDPIIGLYFNNEIILLTAQTLISTVIILVIAEFIPKIIFRDIANSSIKYLSAPIFFFYILFYPVTTFINFISQILLMRIKKFNAGTPESKDVFNKIDLMFLINQAGTNQEGTTKKTDEIKLFRNALDFSSVKVRDCMVPRTEIVAREDGVAKSELINTFVETGFSKIIIYRENIDNIIGYITSKTLFTAGIGSKLPIIEVSFVPETMTANKLLKKLIQDKKSMAIVVDEFGGVSGVITIEDIIEEIFGEIEDEHDYSGLIEKVISEKEYILSGRLEIDHLNETYHLGIPESEEYETLAGFIINRHESIPKINEHFTIDNFEIKTLKASNTKVELVHLKIIA